MIDVEIKKNIGSLNLNVALQTAANVIGITGVSGSGKTTLLNCLSGLITPDHGRISINGQCLFDSSGINVSVHKRNIAVVFQDNRLFPNMSVEGNLKFALKHSRNLHKAFSIEDISKLVEIEHLMKRSVKNLSGGEIKRVAIGRAILSHPSLLLMDEPFAGMDDDLSWRISGILKKIRSTLKIPMILVSHTLDQIQNLCDMLIIMKAGKIEAAGRISDFLASKHTMELLKSLDYSNRIHGTVTGINRSGGISNITISESVEIKAPLSGLPLGSDVSYMLRTKDISISDAHIPNISIQNQIPCMIKKVIYADTGVVCVLDCGIELLAEVTIDTAERLGLQAGETAWALFKTQALTKH